MENDTFNFHGTITTGSKGFVIPTYTQRNMTIYAIPENELEMLSSMNTMATIFFSTFSFFLSLALALFLSGIYADNIQSNLIGKLLFYYGTPIVIVIAVVFFILGIHSSYRRSNLIATIKSESM